jgi:Cas6b C-terminal domain
MGKKLTYERYHWFHGQIKAVRYPNARHLAEKFEISQKQAQRDIEFMRDRLDAFLFYNPTEKGYEYEDDSYELPPVWFKEDELLSLCLALRLASTLPDHVFKDSLYTLLEKFLAFRLLGSSPGLKEIKERKKELLEKILIGNINSMSKSLGYTVPAPIQATIHRIKEVKASLKGTPMLGFLGNFSVNFEIPDYWGIGKSVSRGFGTVIKVNSGQ